MGLILIDYLVIGKKFFAPAKLLIIMVTHPDNSALSVYDCGP